MFSMGVEAGSLCREQRLAGLYRIISPRQVKRAICQCGRRRFCLRCPALFMVYFVLAMGLFCGDCYRQVFRWIGSRHKGSTPARSTLCIARQRLGVKVLIALSRWTVQLLATPATKTTPATPNAFHRNLRLMALDGFVADLPDSQANRLFGYPQGGRTPGMFPQARIVALCEAGTHVFWRWLIKPITTSEAAMANWLIKQLQPDMLLLWDRGFL